MKTKIYQILILIISLFVIYEPAVAKEKLKAVVNINDEFHLKTPPEEISFTNKKDIYYDDIFIPENSEIKAKVIEVQKERRWHKNGFILLNVEGYFDGLYDLYDLYDLYSFNDLDYLDSYLISEDNNLYLVAKKYEKINKKKATLYSAEFALATTASFIIPFSDMVYYFIRGAIFREDDEENWFKSGISCAYEHSIFWFWLKGKPIELKENETIYIKEITKKRAVQLESQIKKRNKKEIKKRKKK